MVNLKIWRCKKILW